VTPEQAIVDALAAVPGLSPTPLPPASVIAGCAWPAFSSHGPARNACLTELTFYVYVALPANPQSVVSAHDLRLMIAVALAEVGQVLSGEAWAIPVEAGGQAVPVLRYTLEI
jgi:hypothetical protein